MFIYKINSKMESLEEMKMGDAKRCPMFNNFSEE
jgi:hypothetical protein